MLSEFLWTMYALPLPLVLVALLAPAALERKSGKTFILFVALMWLVTVAAQQYPRDVSSEFWTYFLSHPGRAGTGVLGMAIGDGSPVLGAAIFIWVLKKGHAKLLWQQLGGLVVGLLLLPVSPIITFHLVSFFHKMLGIPG